MRSRIFWGLMLGAVVAGLLVAGSASPEESNAPTNSPAAAQPAPDAPQVPPPTAAADAAEAPSDEASLTNAPVRLISTERTLPPNLKLTAPVREVIRLAESGLEESVLMAFVTNSMSAFDLGAEEIIYLNDIGVPGTVVAAMIQRDNALKDLAAAGSAAPVEPLPATATNQYAPVAVAGGPYAPQPAEAPAYTEAPPVAEPPPDYAAVEYVPPPAVAVEYSTFYGALAPYGTWVDVGGYGPCWRPTVAVVTPGWRPYWHGGRWVYSDCGWYWMSGYSWGWAPFHYGRWFQHSRWGWCWTPGSVWGPAWVGWRYGGGYCGWAPLPPTAGFGFGLGLTYLGRPARPDCGFGLGANSYTFVSTSHFRDHHVHRHGLPPQDRARVFAGTTPSSRITASNHRIINHGIPSSRVADATRTEVRPVTIRPVTGREARSGRGERFEGDGRTLAVYRPPFQAVAEGSRAARGQARAETRGGATTATLSPVTSGSGTAPAAPASVGGATRRPETTRPVASSRSVGVPGAIGAGSPVPSLSDSTRSATTPTSSRHVVTPARPVQPSLAPAAARPNIEAATVTTGRNPAFTPVIPREPIRPGSASPASSLTITHGNSGRPSTTIPIPARAEPGLPPTTSRPAVSTTEPWRARPTSPAREAITRPSVSVMPQPLPAPAVSAASRTEPSRSIIGSSQSPTRVERPRQSVAPSFPSPTPRPSTSPAFSVPRSTPAPASASTPSIRMPAAPPARSVPAPASRLSTPAPAVSRPAPAPIPAPSIRTPSPSPVRSAPAPAAITAPRASTPSFTPAPAPRPQVTPSRPSPAPTAAPSSSGGAGRSSPGSRGR